MQTTCKIGDKFVIGEVTIQILSVCEEEQTVAFQVTTPEETYVEIIGVADEVDPCQELCEPDFESEFDEFEFAEVRYKSLRVLD